MREKQIFWGVTYSGFLKGGLKKEYFSLADAKDRKTEGTPNLGKEESESEVAQSCLTLPSRGL